MDDEQVDRIARAADEVLAQAVMELGDDDQSGRCFELLTALYQEHGSVGLIIAMQVWCDHVLEHACGGAPSASSLTKVTMINQSTAAMVSPAAAEIPAAHRWAANVVQARLDGDRPRFKQLLAELAAQPQTEVDHRIATLLSTVAVSIANYPRGYSALDAQLRRQPTGPTSRS